MARGKVAAAALAAVAAAALAPAGASARSVLAIGGYGMHLPQQMAADTRLDQAEVDTITQRFMGIYMPLEESDHLELPTGDLFQRPKAALLVSLEGLAVENLDADKSPYLDTLFRSTTVDIADDVSLLSNDELFPGVSMLKALSLPKDVTELVSQEIALDEVPDMISVSLNVAGMSAEAVDAGVAKMVADLNKLYDGKVVFEIAAFNRASTPSRRVLQETSNSSLVQATSLSHTFLIQLWTCVLLLAFIFLLFICVPWSNELDPILYSGLAREDSKQD